MLFVRTVNIQIAFQSLYDITAILDFKTNVLFNSVKSSIMGKFVHTLFILRE